MLGPESSLKALQASPTHDPSLSQIQVWSFEKFNPQSLVRYAFWSREI